MGIQIVFRQGFWILFKIETVKTIKQTAIERLDRFTFEFQFG